MNTAHDPAETRRFALEVVQRLRAAGFESLWAGGCVRDQLLGREPKDYDVATNATPLEVRHVFGHRHTLPLGAAFGVITVLGRKQACPVEVATFRRDAGYSDGRHPDSVSFSSAEEDALRRDFTINGMFFDPLTERVVDYVGGQRDLADGIVRAIRDPFERFAEDKLRMVRAIRFAATFRFQLEATTREAIRQLAAEIVIVSAERIAAELRRILPHPTRRRAVELLSDVRLLPILVPELANFDPESAPFGDESRDAWNRLLRRLDALQDPTFPVALATLLSAVVPSSAADLSADAELSAASDSSRPAMNELVDTVCRRWRLSNDEMNRVSWILQQAPTILRAHELPWPRVQRVLVADGVAELLMYAESVEAVDKRSPSGVDFCRRRLALPLHELNPAPLLNGRDLQQAGLKPGPLFRQLLESLRDQQLEGRISDKTAALLWINQQTRAESGEG